MYCSNCGQRLADGAKHCPNCGAAVVYDYENPAENKPAEDPYGAWRADAEPRDPARDPFTEYSYGQNTNRPVQPAQPAYGYAPQYTKADGYALTGLILAIVSAVCSCLPFIGLPCAIIGIVFSAKGLKSEIRKSMATVALILSIIFTICNVIALIGLIISLTQVDTWQQIIEDNWYEWEEFRDFYR